MGKKSLRLVAMVMAFVFGLTMALLPAKVTAQQQQPTQAPAQAGAAAGKAGAEAGAATAAGISTGTIVAGVLAAAAIAAIAAASGGGGGEAVVQPTTGQQAASTLISVLNPAQESSMSTLVQSLNSNELKTLADVSDYVFKPEMQSALANISTAQQLQSALNTPTSALYSYINSITEQDKKTMILNFLNNLINKGDNAVKSFVNVVKDSPQADLSKVKDAIKQAVTDYQNFVNSLLTTLHPGYYVTVSHVGNNIYVTTLHKQQ